MEIDHALAGFHGFSTAFPGYRGHSDSLSIQATDINKVAGCWASQHEYERHISSNWHLTQDLWDYNVHSYLCILALVPPQEDSDFVLLNVRKILDMLHFTHCGMHQTTIKTLATHRITPMLSNTLTTLHDLNERTKLTLKLGPLNLSLTNQREL
jgi:hypothetical protein